MRTLIDNCEAWVVRTEQKYNSRSSVDTEVTLLFPGMSEEMTNELAFGGVLKVTVQIKERTSA